MVNINFSTIVFRWCIPPCKAYTADTASATMALLLVADLCDGDAKAKVSHPFEPFTKSAFHGGVHLYQNYTFRKI